MASVFEIYRSIDHDVSSQNVLLKYTYMSCVSHLKKQQLPKLNEWNIREKNYVKGAKPGWKKSAQYFCNTLLKHIVGVC